MVATGPWVPFNQMENFTALLKMQKNEKILSDVINEKVKKKFKLSEEQLEAINNGTTQNADVSKFKAELTEKVGKDVKRAGFITLINSSGSGVKKLATTSANMRIAEIEEGEKASNVEAIPQRESGAFEKRAECMYKAALKVLGDIDESTLNNKMKLLKLYNQNYKEIERLSGELMSAEYAGESKEVNMKPKIKPIAVGYPRDKKKKITKKGINKNLQAVKKNQTEKEQPVKVM